MILNDRSRRLAFQFGRQSALRASSGALDQVSEQLRAERAKVRELKAEVAVLRREVAEARFTIAQRDTLDAFAAVSSPSASVH